VVPTNTQEGIKVTQPKTFEERAAVATQMCGKLNLKIPTLIDNLDNKVNYDYGGWPDRLYLVGRDGKIAYQGGLGPRGFLPDELETAIKKELAARPAAKTP